MGPFASLIDTLSGFIGVANTIDGVAEIFNNSGPSLQLVLCIDVPRCKYVTSIAMGHEFFNNLATGEK